jgi:hypothetical protein
MRKPYYHTCKYCGATLDPCEKCDCQKTDSQLSIDTSIHNKQMEVSGNNDNYQKVKGGE